MSASDSGPPFRRASDDYCTVFALSVWSAITLIAAVLISRRLGGAFRADLGAAVPCVSATLALLVSLAANTLWSAANSAVSGRKQVMAGAVTLLPPLTVAAALWNSPSTLIGGYLAALSVLSALAIIVIGNLSRVAGGGPQLFGINNGRGEVLLPIADRRGSQRSGDDAPAAPCLPAMPSNAGAALPVDEPLDDEADECDPSILQWITRRQLAGGAEAVEGSLRMHFGPGEQSAVAHVSFVPPLCDRPRAECQALVDFDGRVRIGLAQAYGLRIEARRSKSDSGPISIDVGFLAQVGALQSAAA